MKKALVLLILSLNFVQAATPLPPTALEQRQPSRVLRLQPGLWAAPLPPGVTAVEWPELFPKGWNVARGADGQPYLGRDPSGQSLMFVQVPPRGDDLILSATVDGQPGALHLLVDLIGFPNAPCKCLPRRP